MKEFISVFTLCWLVVAAKFYFFPSTDQSDMANDSQWQEQANTFADEFPDEQPAQAPQPAPQVEEYPEPEPPEYNAPPPQNPPPRVETAYKAAPQPAIPAKPKAPHAARPAGTMSPQEFKQKQAEHILEDIDTLLNCLDNSNCGIDLEQGSYGGNVYYRSNLINDKLKELLSVGKDAVGKERWTELALQFTDSDNGNVSTKGVEMLAQLPPRSEFADKLMSTMRENDHVPMLIQSMQELKRYPEMTADIELVYTDILRSDRPYVAEQIADNILPFINEDNIYTYEAILSELPNDSRIAQNLRKSLEGYRARQPH